MKVTFKTHCAGALSFHMGEVYDVEPGLAKSLIESGHASLVEGESDDEDELLAGIPHSAILYSKGIKDPSQINIDELYKAAGFSHDMVDDIKEHLTPAVKPQMPEGTPHKERIEKHGITSNEQFLKAVENGITFLNPDEIAEVCEFLEVGDEDEAGELVAEAEPGEQEPTGEPAAEETTPAEPAKEEKPAGKNNKRNK